MSELAPWLLCLVDNIGSDIDAASFLSMLHIDSFFFLSDWGRTILQFIDVIYGSNNREDFYSKGQFLMLVHSLILECLSASYVTSIVLDSGGSAGGPRQI